MTRPDYPSQEGQIGSVRFAVTAPYTCGKLDEEQHSGRESLPPWRGALTSQWALLTIIVGTTAYRVRARSHRRPAPVDSPRPAGRNSVRLFKPQHPSVRVEFAEPADDPTFPRCPGPTGAGTEYPSMRKGCAIPVGQCRLGVTAGHIESRPVFQKDEGRRQRERTRRRSSG